MEKEKKLKIYLAGEMNDKWRKDIVNYYNETYDKKELEIIEWINPKQIMGEKHFYNVADKCVNHDLLLIDNSDYIIAYLNRKGLYGTIVEIMHGLYNNKSISIILGDFDELESVVGTDGGFPYHSPYWFLIQYTTHIDLFKKSIINKKIYNEMSPQTLENILELDILANDNIKKNQDKEDAVNLLLEDLKNEENIYEKTKILNQFKRNYKTKINAKNKYKQCQICKFTFKKKNGDNYNEMHHIIPLSKNGKDAEINTLILCANCHRQFHYADVKLDKILNNIVVINNEEKKIYK